MNSIIHKLKEVLMAVLPVVLIVSMLTFTLIPIDGLILGRFYIGSILIILGLTLFLIGIDTGLSPIGREMGKFLAKSNKLGILCFGGLILGFFVSVAEPDLHILASQVDAVTSGALAKNTLVIIVSAGVAVLVMMGLMRIVFAKPLKFFFLLIYGFILCFATFSSSEFLAISFDSSGATTGALTVPFILAIASGVSGLKRDSTSSEEDSFGLLGIASGGAILAVLMAGVFTSYGEISGDIVINLEASGTLLSPFFTDILPVVKDGIMALSPIVIIFFIANYFFIRVSKRLLKKMAVGLVFTLVGLILFMLGVHAGFMSVGTIVGYKLAGLGHSFVLGVSFIIGLVTILAEPAVYVLTKQIESVTSGYVGRGVVLFALCIGVGTAIFLSILRIIIPNLELWHFLLPGYIIALGLSMIVSPLFVGIAFDAGGVASGPMTATFILAFAQGAASRVEGADVMVDGFGIIAMVAMMPLIVLQLLGLMFKLKSGKEKIDERS